MCEITMPENIKWVQGHDSQRRKFDPSKEPALMSQPQAVGGKTTKNSRRKNFVIWN